MAESEKDCRFSEDTVVLSMAHVDMDNPEVEVWRNVCEARAEIRNKLRVPLLETTGFFNNEIFDMTGEDIMREEEERLLSRARRNFRMGVFREPRDAYYEALIYRTRKEGTEDLYFEEYGKYRGAKIVGQWRTNGLNQALDSFREFTGRPYLRDEQKESVKEETLFMMTVEIKHIIEQGNYSEALAGLFKLAEYRASGLADLRDLGLLAVEEVNFIAYVNNCFLPDALRLNPRIYEAVRDFLVGLGFVAVKTVDKCEEMKKAVREIILQAAKKSLCYLDEVMDEFERMKLIDRKEILNWEEYNECVGDRLSVIMQESPEAYLQARDNYVKRNLLLADEADKVELVCVSFNLFLMTLNDLNPVAGMGYAEYVRNKGVNIGVEPEIRQYWLRLSMEGDLRGDGGDAKSGWVRNLKVVNQMLADKANRVMAQGKDHEMDVFNGLRMIHCRRLARFLRSFPHFKTCFSQFNVDHYPDNDDDRDLY